MRKPTKRNLHYLWPPATGTCRWSTPSCKTVGRTAIFLTTKGAPLCGGRLMKGRQPSCDDCSRMPTFKSTSRIARKRTRGRAESASSVCHTSPTGLPSGSSPRRHFPRLTCPAVILRGDSPLPVSLTGKTESSGLPSIEGIQTELAPAQVSCWLLRSKGGTSSKRIYFKAGNASSMLSI